VAGIFSKQKVTENPTPSLPSIWKKTESNKEWTGDREKNQPPVDLRSRTMLDSMDMTREDDDDLENNGGLAPRKSRNMGNRAGSIDKSLKVAVNSMSSVSSTFGKTKHETPKPSKKDKPKSNDRLDPKTSRKKENFALSTFGGSLHDRAEPDWEITKGSAERVAR